MPPPNDKSAELLKRQKGRLIKGGASKSKTAQRKEIEAETRSKAQRMEDLYEVPPASAIILGQNNLSLLSKSGNRLTTGAHIRVAELDHDPIAFAVKVIKGEALTENHPFLQILYDVAADCRKSREEGKVLDVEKIVEDLLDKGQMMLSDSWTPSKLRLDANKDLLKYLYPTLKAVDHSGTVNHKHTHIAILQAQEVEVFRDTFNDEY